MAMPVRSALMLIFLPTGPAPDNRLQSYALIGPEIQYDVWKEEAMAKLDRSKSDPWTLKTPPGTSEYTMQVEDKDGKRILVCTVGKTVLHYDARCVDDLHAMLKAAGDWVELGGADEQKPAREGTVEAWGRSPANPIGGWYGLKKGLRGRFGVYLPPLMEALGLCELEHNPKNNRMRAK